SSTSVSSSAAAAWPYANCSSEWQEAEGVHPFPIDPQTRPAGPAAGSGRATWSGWARAGALLLAAALLAGCGSARVIERPGQARAGGPVKGSKPTYGATHVVKRGETVYRVATSNGVTALDLALWNSIPPPYVIPPGQRLRLYPGGTPASRPASASRAAASGAA